MRRYSTRRRENGARCWRGEPFIEIVVEFVAIQSSSDDKVITWIVLMKIIIKSHPVHTIIAWIEKFVVPVRVLIGPFLIRTPHKCGIVCVGFSKNLLHTAECSAIGSLISA